jgi:Uma2 family endonuclease
MGGGGMARGMASNATKLTYEDFVLFPDDGRRHEIIDGEHFVTPSPARRHQRVLRNLTLVLVPFVREARLGEVLFAPFDVVFTRHDVVEPDLLYISAERSGVLTEANVQGAPDLVVEVLSPSSRRQDEVLKRDLYERGGVAEYWLVDPDAETVKVFRLGEVGRFGRPLLLSLRDGDSLSTPLLPRLEISLAAVFAD